jgi:hypothetical protein
MRAPLRGAAPQIALVPGNLIDGRLRFREVDVDPAKAGELAVAQIRLLERDPSLPTEPALPIRRSLNIAHPRGVFSSGVRSGCPRLYDKLRGRSARPVAVRSARGRWSMRS